MVDNKQFFFFFFYLFFYLFVFVFPLLLLLLLKKKKEKKKEKTKTKKKKNTQKKKKKNTKKLIFYNKYKKWVSFIYLIFVVLFGDDPSAGSPTETLLRLLLPLNDQV